MFIDIILVSLEKLGDKYYRYPSIADCFQSDMIAVRNVCTFSLQDNSNLNPNQVLEIYLFPKHVYFVGEVVGSSFSFLYNCITTSM